jgi:hypothetical protein
MPIKRLLSNVRDVKSLKQRRMAKLDKSPKAIARRKAAKAYYKKNKAKIATKRKITHKKMTPAEKQFNKKRALFLKSLKPKTAKPRRKP